MPKYIVTFDMSDEQKNAIYIESSNHVASRDITITSDELTPELRSLELVGLGWNYGPGADGWFLHSYTDRGVERLADMTRVKCSAPSPRIEPDKFDALAIVEAGIRKAAQYAAQYESDLAADRAAQDARAEARAAESRARQQEHDQHVATQAAADAAVYAAWDAWGLVNGSVELQHAIREGYPGVKERIRQEIRALLPDISGTDYALDLGDELTEGERSVPNTASIRNRELVLNAVKDLEGKLPVGMRCEVSRILRAKRHQKGDPSTRDDLDADGYYLVKGTCVELTFTHGCELFTATYSWGWPAD